MMLVVKKLRTEVKERLDWVNGSLERKDGLEVDDM